MKMLGGLILSFGLIAVLLSIIFWLVINMPSVDEILDSIIYFLEEEPQVVAFFGLGTALVGAALLNEWM